MSCLRKKLSYLFCFFIFVIFYSLVNVHGAWAAGENPYSAITITLNETIDDYITDGQVRWFKLTPSSSAVYNNTHLVIQTYGNTDTYLYVFGNLQNALLEKTDYYDDDSGDGYNAKVEIPMAYTGPYYIKVMGCYDDIEGPFQINCSTTSNPPEQPEARPCIAESVAEGEQSGYRILMAMREVRDNLLKNTARGEKIIDLYYRSSPLLVKAALFDGEFRNALAQNLLQLTEVMECAAACESNIKGSYIITEQDYNSLTNVYNLVRDKLPEDMVSELETLWQEMELNNCQGLSIEESLEKAGLFPKKYIKTSMGVKYIADELIIKLKDNDSSKRYVAMVNELVGDYGVESINPLVPSSLKSLLKQGLNEAESLPEVYVVKLSGGSSADSMAVAEDLNERTDVEYAEPNYYVSAMVDVYYNYQWSLENTGQDDGTTGSDINYTGLRELLQGADLGSTMIAVVDTGVNYEFADFGDKVLTDIDIDFVNHDNDAMDDANHGTHVAGIIGAKSNNGYSMTGINDYCTILPVKVLDSDGSGTAADVAAGIMYSAAMGAKVINLSLGTSSFSNVIEDALIFATQTHNALCVAASGNNGDSTLCYPASSQYTLSVGATNNTDSRASFSNYGEGLDVVAPGVNIPSLVANGKVVYYNGTSMATPHVSALAGLVYSKNPGINWQEVSEIIKQGCDDLGTSGYDSEYGWGRIDAVKIYNGGAPKGQVESVTLSVNLPSPQPVGTEVVFTASAKGTSNNILYQFWVKDPTGAWASSGEYSNKDTYCVTGNMAGTYTVVVYAKDAQSQNWQAINSICFTFEGSGQPVSLKIIPSVPSPQKAGTAVTFTAHVDGLSSPLYQFWARGPDGTWVSSGPYTNDNTYQLSNTLSGTYSVCVYVKNNGASTWQVYDIIDYTFN